MRSQSMLDNRANSLYIEHKFLRRIKQGFSQIVRTAILK